MPNTHTFKGVLTASGWLENVSVVVDDSGCILSATPGASGAGAKGYALPGFQNAHSHAFQYAMAGLAEFHDHEGSPDSFWSWRNAMYDIALSISPDQLEDIATMLYSEMARHGYTSVAEFHYLHHQPNGNRYDNLAEMGERLVAAAATAGIRITLIPMFYQVGGFGVPAGPGQRRFLSRNIDEYYELLDASRTLVSGYSHASLGMGIHSLRAVKPEDVIRVCSEFDGRLPFHIHIAEQLKEIEDSFSFHGQRPVQWLLDNCPVNENYHLVHATHLSDTELSGIARSGAHVVICPSTEGNLGDGFFRFREFRDLNGRWSIGTDSHIGLNPLEELRLLDYGQRLLSHSRATYIRPGNGNSGFNAINSAWQGGRSAMGASPTRFFDQGEPLDAVIFNSDSPLLAASTPEDLTNTLLYTCDASNVVETLVQGKSAGCSLEQDSSITQTYVNTLKNLRSR